MSAIRGLYAYLASIQIEFTSETGQSVSVGALDLHQLGNSVQSADMPKRLLLPVGNQSANESQFAICGNSEVEWVVCDLMLWRPVAQGIGLIDVAADLVRYTGAYADKLKTIRCSIPPNVMLKNVRIDAPDIHDFAVGAESQAFGVKVWLTFAEYL